MTSHPIVAATLDFSMRPLERVRAKVVPKATGDVLELGMGTGLNLPHYGELTSLTACEPDPHMRKRALARASERAFDLDDASAESLPYDDERFDTVVATFVLCTIPDPVAALREARRVLRPGGVLRFAEHVGSPQPRVRAFQRWLDPLWGHFAGGCHLSRDALALIEAAGFSEVEHRAHGRQRYALAPVISGLARR